MGFDLVTVEKVTQKGVFKQMSDGKGYFRHTGGMTLALALAGVDLAQEAHRRVGFDDVEPQTTSLGMAMSINNGLQVLPEECRLIADKLTKENLDEYVRGQCLLSEEEYELYKGTLNFNIEDHVYNDGWIQFLLDYATFHKQAANYGGYYVF